MRLPRLGFEACSLCASACWRRSLLPVARPWRPSTASGSSSRRRSFELMSSESFASRTASPTSLRLRSMRVPPRAGLAAAEQELLEACARVNELATARRDQRRLGLRRSAARRAPCRSANVPRGRSTPALALARRSEAAAISAAAAGRRRRDALGSTASRGSRPPRSRRSRAHVRSARRPSRFRRARAWFDLGRT